MSLICYNNKHVYPYNINTSDLIKHIFQLAFICRHNNMFLIRSHYSCTFLGSIVTKTNGSFSIHIEDYSRQYYTYKIKMPGKRVKNNKKKTYTDEVIAIDV